MAKKKHATVLKDYRAKLKDACRPTKVELARIYLDMLIEARAVLMPWSANMSAELGKAAGRAGFNIEETESVMRQMTEARRTEMKAAKARRLAEAREPAGA